MLGLARAHTTANKVIAMVNPMKGKKGSIVSSFRSACVYHVVGEQAAGSGEERVEDQVVAAVVAETDQDLADSEDPGRGWAWKG